MNCEICLFCKNSFSGDSILDGSEILICFSEEGHEGQERIVDEDYTCENFKGN